MTASMAQECVEAGRWRIAYDPERGEACIFHDDSLVLGRLTASARVHTRDFGAAGRANICKPADSCTLVVEHYTYKYLMRRIFTIDPVRDCIALLLEVESGDGRIAAQGMCPMQGVCKSSVPRIRIENAQQEGWRCVLEGPSGGRLRIACTPSQGSAVEAQKVRSPRIVLFPSQ